MEIPVYLAVLLLIITKLLDTVSTLHKITFANDETNPFARRLMSRYSARTAIWLVSLLALGIIILSAIIALQEGVLFQGAYLVFAIVISVVQVAVAYGNWQGRDNWITKYVRVGYFYLQRRFPGR